MRLVFLATFKLASLCGTYVSQQAVQPVHAQSAWLAPSLRLRECGGGSGGGGGSSGDNGGGICVKLCM